MPTPFPLGPGTNPYRPNRYKTHQVKYGETLASIAKQYGLTSQQLVNNNPGLTRVNTGAVLNIPQNNSENVLGAANLLTTGVSKFFDALGRAGVAQSTIPRGIQTMTAENPQLFTVRGLQQYNTQGWNRIANQSTKQAQSVAANTGQSAMRTVNNAVGAAQTSYQPTGWNAIVNQTPGITGQDLFAGLSEKQKNEYGQYLDWFTRDPARAASLGGMVPSPEEYFTSKYAGGGGDFWGYMQSIQAGQPTGSSAQRRNTKERMSYQEAKENDPTLTYKQWQMGWKKRKQQYGSNPNESSTVNETSQDTAYISGEYAQYYDPMSFGVVSWRGY